MSLRRMKITFRIKILAEKLIIIWKKHFLVNIAKMNSKEKTAVKDMKELMQDTLASNYHIVHTAKNHSTHQVN